MTFDVPFEQLSPLLSSVIPSRGLFESETVYRITLPFCSIPDKTAYLRIHISIEYHKLPLELQHHLLEFLDVTNRAIMVFRQRRTKTFTQWKLEVVYSPSLLTFPDPRRPWWLRCWRTWLKSMRYAPLVSPNRTIRATKLTWDMWTNIFILWCGLSNGMRFDEVQNKKRVFERCLWSSRISYFNFQILPVLS